LFYLFPSIHPSFSFFLSSFLHFTSWYDSRAACTSNSIETGFVWYSLQYCIPNNYDYDLQTFTSSFYLDICGNEYSEAGGYIWPSNPDCYQHPLEDREFYIPTTCYHLPWEYLQHPYAPNVESGDFSSYVLGKCT
jgi:hypothetical protein